MPAHPMHRFHIDGLQNPPRDWADPPSEWEYDVDDGMHVSAMAVVALIALVFGLAMGWLIWS